MPVNDPDSLGIIPLPENIVGNYLPEEDMALLDVIPDTTIRLQDVKLDNDLALGIYPESSLLGNVSD